MSTATVPPPADAKTFRGRSLEELLPRIRDELGSDAVILRQRDGLMGGVGGFFQKRCVEIDARPGTKRVDAYDDGEVEARAALDAGPAWEQAEEPVGAAASGQDDPEDEPRFTHAPGPAPGAGGAPAAGDVGELAMAEGMQSPAIRALFEAAAPFAEQLRAADAAIAPEPADVLPAAPAPASAPPAEPPPAAEPDAANAAAAPAEPAPAEPRDAPAEPQAGGERPPSADALEIALVDGGLSPELSADLVAETVSHLLPFGSPRQLKRLVRTSLARQIPVQAPRALGGTTVAFVGAGGSGKTLSTARVAAAYAARSDLPVVCLSLRPRDGGASLRALLEPAGVAVEVVENAAEARTRAAGAGRALVVVDTPAVSPGDAAGLRALGAELRKLGGVEVQVCVPATLSAVAAGRLLDALAPLDLAGIVLTHVDETPQIGQVVELAMSGRAPLSFVGRDTDLHGGLTLADPAALAALVLA